MLPLKDNNPTSRFPVVTVALIAICVAVFFWQLNFPTNSRLDQAGFGPVDQSSLEYGAIPYRITHPSTGDWVFGNNIEERLGRLKFALFYVLAGLIAVYTQSVIDTGSTAPTIGASGAIAGVLGAYALLYPRARVLTLIFIIFFVTLVEIPALILLALWFILQFIPALGQVAVQSGGDQGVAYFAHVGGFLFGLAVAGLILLRTGRREPQPRLPVY